MTDNATEESDVKHEYDATRLALFPSLKSTALANILTRVPIYTPTTTHTVTFQDPFNTATWGIRTPDKPHTDPNTLYDQDLYDEIHSKLPKRPKVRHPIRLVTQCTEDHRFISYHLIDPDSKRTFQSTVIETTPVSSDSSVGYRIVRAQLMACTRARTTDPECACDCIEQVLAYGRVVTSVPTAILKSEFKGEFMLAETTQRIAFVDWIKTVVEHAWWNDLVREFARAMVAIMHMQSEDLRIGHGRLSVERLYVRVMDEYDHDVSAYTLQFTARAKRGAAPILTLVLDNRNGMLEIGNFEKAACMHTDDGWRRRDMQQFSASLLAFLTTEDMIKLNALPESLTVMLHRAMSEAVHPAELFLHDEDDVFGRYVNVAPSLEGEGDMRVLSAIHVMPW